jgi:hypothetical protein
VSLTTAVKRGVDDARRDERCVSGSENSLLAIDPLFDLAGDDIHDFFLAWMLVEAVRLARRERCVEDGQLFRGCRSGVADPATVAPAGLVQPNLSCDAKVVAHIENLPPLHEWTSRRQNGAPARSEAPVFRAAG